MICVMREKYPPGGAIITLSAGSHVFSNRSVKQREDILTNKLAANTHVIVRKTQIPQCAWNSIRWWAIMF